MLGRFLLAIVTVGALAGPSWAAGAEAFTDPAKAGRDYKIQGEYKGELKVQDESSPFGAQVIALGDGKFRGVFYFGGLPGDGWKRGDMQLSVDSATEDGKIMFTGDNGSAKIADGKMTVLDAAGTELGTLSKVERTSPTLGAKPPQGAKVLFDGTSASAWASACVVAR